MYLITLKKLSIFLLLLLFLNTISQANSKIIDLATDAWPPFYGPELKNKGFVSQLVIEAFKRKGYEVKIHFVPWKRAMEYSKKGDYVGLMGAFFKQERTAYFKYTKAISKSEIVFFVKQNSKITFTKLSDLRKYKIGIVKAYHYSDEFDKEKHNLHLFESRHSTQNIKHLLEGRVDLILGSKKVILSLVKKHYKNSMSKIKPLSPIVHSNKLYIAISKNIKNYKKITQDFNDALSSMHKDGRYETIIKSSNF